MKISQIALMCKNILLANKTVLRVLHCFKALKTVRNGIERLQKCLFEGHTIDYHTYIGYQIYVHKS